MWFEVVQREASKSLTYNYCDDEIMFKIHDDSLFGFTFPIETFAFDNNIISPSKTHTLMLSSIDHEADNTFGRVLGEWFTSVHHINILCDLEEYTRCQQSILSSIEGQTDITVDICLLLEGLDTEEDLLVPTDQHVFAIPIKRLDLQNGQEDEEARLFLSMVQKIKPTELIIDLIGSPENKEYHYQYDKILAVKSLRMVNIGGDHVEFMDLNNALDPSSNITSLSCQVLSHMCWFKDGLPDDDLVPCNNTFHSIRSLSTIESSIETFCNLLLTNTTLTDFTINNNNHMPSPQLVECFNHLLVINKTIKHLGVKGDFITKEFLQSIEQSTTLQSLEVGLKQWTDSLFDQLLHSLSINHTIRDLID
ncbi:hypothetical protein DFA_10522 [Cavenderia fasciculata]|uniref:Uncharacterized protein n=1 Tax=Cavenderia fasciculata TaxID=261658 RepID=F4QAG1_CACFS|nr:uncharacterized protein DFA_10522 [Cavenderia fasciculata]EGG15680.1 hypothetical protein DFA_10522 [Cavenderia fasciculata]|eukprot:XP_004354422.1 hypothetical protein DFA_10522 [Cavenderia fasciculata]